MGVFNGKDIVNAYYAMLGLISRRIDEIPFRRLKDLRNDEISDFVSDFNLDKIEVCFDHPIFRDVIDAKEVIYDPIHLGLGPKNVCVKGRRFLIDVLVTSGVNYVHYSPRGGAEEFDGIFLADRHFEEMKLVQREDGRNYINYSIFLSETDLDRLSQNQIQEHLLKQNKEYLIGSMQQLEHLNARIGALNENIIIETNKMIAEKIKHDTLTDKIVGAVGIQLVSRNDLSEKGKKIEIVPRKFNSPLSSSEPYEGYFIDASNYKAIIETIRQHLIATENLPAAIQKLDDEELIRDTILWTLQSTYFIANGETFRQSGKTDISIAFKDKSAFIAECKIWRGASIISPAIDQLLGYTTWRDSKACIIIFNLDVQNYEKVCAETFEEAKRHSRFKMVIKTNSKNDFVISYQDPLDEKSQIEVSYLIANYVSR